MPHALDRHVADALHEASVQITRDWVEILTERLGVDPERALPSESILNHIPAVLDRVADFIGDPEQQPLDAFVREDLGRLADLRRRQGFSLGDILAEFATLSELVEDTVSRAIEAYTDEAPRVAVVRVVGKTKDAIYTLGAETASRFRAWDERQRQERLRLLETYTAMLSHELGNRLGAAETAVRLLQESELTLPPKRVKRLYDLILKSVESGLETVDGVRSLFQRSDGEEARVLPLRAVVRDAVHQMRVHAAERGISIHLNRAGSEEPIDAERFPLVLFNLVTNAIRHHDVPQQKGTVSVDVDDATDSVTVSVVDDGPGIPPEMRDTVFEPQVRDPDGEGAGLGLAIAREAVEQMGGQISFACGDGRGTTFRFTIPRGGNPG